MRPYSIIGAPFSVWVAPAGTAYPLLTAAPAVAWTLLGENGTRSQDEDGVTVTHGQTIEEFRAAGSTGPLKAFRTEEELTIGFNLADLTLEAYRYVINSVTITTVAAGAGAIGKKTIGLSRGFAVTEMAMLIRGPSPYNDDTFVMQYEVPRVYEGGSPAPQFTKGQAALLGCEFHALEDLTAATEAERFGRLIAQTAAALP